MMIDVSEKDDKKLNISELFYGNAATQAAVEEMCIYHPMGVYYYVGCDELEMNMTIG